MPFLSLLQKQKMFVARNPENISRMDCCIPRPLLFIVVHSSLMFIIGIL
jgi:hypothetical protein